jgi:hypothetical protein
MKQRVLSLDLVFGLDTIMVHLMFYWLGVAAVMVMVAVAVEAASKIDDVVALLESWNTTPSLKDVDIMWGNAVVWMWQTELSSESGVWSKVWRMLLRLTWADSGK